MPARRISRAAFACSSVAASGRQTTSVTVESLLRRSSGAAAVRRPGPAPAYVIGLLYAVLTLRRPRGFVARLVAAFTMTLVPFALVAGVPGECAGDDDEQARLQSLSTRSSCDGPRRASGNVAATNLATANGE